MTMILVTNPAQLNLDVMLWAWFRRGEVLVRRGSTVRSVGSGPLSEGGSY
jgi:hypothetical protein